jgi:hypothetical protein
MVAKRIQLMATWAGIAFLALFGLFFFPVAHYIPPQPPSWSAEAVKQFYLDNTVQIRVGQVGALTMSVLIFPFWALISLHIARIERARGAKLPILALTQFAGAVLLQVFFIVCNMLWIVATYRPELDASTVRMLHDAGWLVFVMVFPGYMLQLFCIGTASLIDQSVRPVWPRWAGYLNFWVGLSGAGGALAVFFKEGPFAWNGFIGFYLPVACFVIWIVTMTVLMHRWTVRDAADGKPVADPAQTALAAL